MAKKIYSIPLMDIKQAIKINRLLLNKALKDSQLLEYNKTLGKCYFNLQVEKFIEFVHIQHNTTYALSILKYFSSNSFLDNIFKLLDFNQLSLSDNISQRDFFYHFCFIIKDKNKNILNLFLQKVFIHFHPTFHQQSNIKINFINMAKELIQFRKLEFKESFGEKDDFIFYKIWINGIMVIDDKGKSVAILRKKSYKIIFYRIIDGYFKGINKK